MAISVGVVGSFASVAGNLEATCGTSGVLKESGDLLAFERSVETGDVLSEKKNKMFKQKNFKNSRKAQLF